MPLGDYDSLPPLGFSLGVDKLNKSHSDAHTQIGCTALYLAYSNVPINLRRTTFGSSFVVLGLLPPIELIDAIDRLAKR